MNQTDYIEQLYNLKRDLISDGFDEALERIQHHFPIKIISYPSGERCWTWKIPEKWTCHEAFIKDMQGNTILDYRDNPLHVASYSASIDAVIPREELLEHVYTHPRIDDAVPFIFYYYTDNWAFCTDKKTTDRLTDKEYQVSIQCTHEPGHLKIGEYFLQGKSDQCFVLCAHLDHPMQANDGLSGVVTSLFLMDRLKQMENRYFSYRLLIVPETIGSISWLSHNEEEIEKIIGGLFLEMTGLNIPPALQLSYSGDSQIDKTFSVLHKRSEKGAWVGKYREVIGNDERQFNAPGVRIPMLSYARCYPRDHEDWPFPGYHSSKDNLEITHQEALDRSLNHVFQFIQALENNYYPKNLFKGEIFLSGYNISVDRHKHLDIHRNMLKIMDRIDGTNSVADIADCLSIDYWEVHQFLEKLYNNGLITREPIYPS